jgi:hypothetical protein
MWVQGTNLYRVYNYNDSRAYGYKRSRILSRIEGMVWEWDGSIWFDIALMFVPFVTLCAPLWIKLCAPLCLYDHAL